MNGPSLSRTGRVLTALVLSCLVAGLAPAAATAAPAPSPSSSTVALAKGKVKVDAKLAKGKVKKGEKVKLTGKLDVLAEGSRLDATEPLIVQQQISAGAWIDIATTSCRPNGSYSLNLSFSLSASLSLRVYHPETTIYASAYSSVFALLVI